MPTIFIKDDFRAAVEAASGGRQTVLYTAQGQPSVMNIIPAFNLQDIDPSLGTGVHPAFVVGGVQKSQIFVGTYQGIAKTESCSRCLGSIRQCRKTTTGSSTPLAPMALAGTRSQIPSGPR